MTFRAGNGALPLLRAGWSCLIVLFAVAVTLVLRRFSLNTVGVWLTTIPLWAAGMFWYLPKLSASIAGRFEEIAVRGTYGVLWKRELYVPLDALRTFEIWTPPLHRLFRCRTVVLRFAGGSALLPLLDAATARELTQALENSEEMG